MLQVKVHLKSLDGEGISFYRNVQLPLDLFYPLGFILTYSIGCLWVFNKIGKWRLAGYIGAVCAVLAGISDYIENFMIWKMLDLFPQVAVDLVASSSLATLAKSISTTIAMTLFILGFLVIGINKLKK